MGSISPYVDAANEAIIDNAEALKDVAGTLLEGLEAYSGRVGGSAVLASEDFLRSGNALLDMASDYAKGLMNAAEGVASDSERLMLRDNAAEMMSNIENIRNQGAEAIGKYGESAAMAGRAAAAAKVAGAAGLIFDSK